ncbi:hypothetical protein Bhyg_10136 [Pseudolycoriella hygida]|uniref:Uncharacterized protein n=1 Tax=Pseudolycoriella hygida TaxID=35572 RepID=A0A9Q0MSY2_9DIPT|nr:hypothetical protein Bhyg_10136 [Pseudolycoriella hygida]
MERGTNLINRICYYVSRPMPMRNNSEVMFAYSYLLMKNKRNVGAKPSMDDVHPSNNWPERNQHQHNKIIQNIVCKEREIFNESDAE